MTDLLILFVILCFFSILYLLDYFQANELRHDDTIYPTFLFNKHEYYNSPEWARKRQAALKAANYTCEMCHSPLNLHVHYISYANIFREHPSDLACLCHSCHEQVHRVYGHPQSMAEYTTQHYPLLPTHY